VQMENGEGFEVIRTIPAPTLPYGKPSTTYTLVHLPADQTNGGTILIVINLKPVKVIFLITVSGDILKLLVLVFRDLET